MRRAVVVGFLLAACSGPSAGPDSGVPEPDAPPVDARPPHTGHWDDPIPVTVSAQPFEAAGDTSTAPNVASSYDCAPTIDESGGEVVFLLQLDASTPLRIGVDDRPGDAEDVDLAVVSTPPTGAVATGCVARGNLAIEPTLAAGDWYVVVDSFADASGPHGGPFHLSIVRADPGECLVNPIPACTDGDAPDVDGVPTEPAGLGGCPAGMTRIAAATPFCIDRWEDALVLDTPTGPVGHSPYANPGTANVRAVSAPGVVPQGYINEVEASAACVAAGKRLCSDTEWLRACQGASGYTYPYGNTRVDGACNDARACHPAVQYFMSSDSSVFSKIDNSCVGQLPDALAPTGSYAACQTDDGVFDMMGNLHEWTSDPAGTFRGGFYVDTVLNGNGCLYATTAHDVTHWDYSTGFRCCADLP